jgi:DNA ligase-1
MTMNKPWTVIAELEADNSRLAKEAVIKRESDADNTELFRGFRATYDAMVTFGVKKVEKKTGDGRGLNAENFWQTARDLAERKLTGNAAQVAINYMRMNAKEDEWNNWYQRILVKDLKCGVSETTINKIADEKFAIPKFECQLAQDGAKVDHKVVGNKLIEVKLDGVRVITIVYPSGQVDQYSRNGKELLNFDHIKKQFAKHAKLLRVPTVFDGEVMSSSFQDLMKQVHRKDNVNASDAVLHVFDWLSLDEFKAGVSNTPQIQRSTTLSNWINPLQEHMPNVSVVGQELVDLDTMQGQARFKMINTQAIAGGYEGIMLKSPDAGYECKRGDAWLKIKPFIEVTLTAVAIEEGTGKNAGRMGAVLFEGEDDGKFIRVSVGGGWTDKQRDEVWADKDAVLGQLGEVRADAATKSQGSDDVWSLRFPRFKVWRGFARGEKL